MFRNIKYFQIRRTRESEIFASLTLGFKYQEMKRESFPLELFTYCFIYPLHFSLF